MKTYFYLVMFALLPMLFACSDDDKDDVYKTYSLNVELTYPDGVSAIADVPVVLTDAKAITYDGKTNADGIASFTVPAGLYQATVSDRRTGDDFSVTMYNGNKSDISVGDTGDDITYVGRVSLVESKTSQLVIKELYTGGISYTNESDGKPKTYHFDKYVILYNNSAENLSLDNIALAMILPYNSGGTNKDYVDDKLLYDGEGWTPAGTGIWYFQEGTTIEAGKQMVIALNNATDHTPTYPTSVNLAKAEYYCTYDIEVYPNTTYYPAPSENIPTSHYLKAYHYGTGNAWPLSSVSPAFFLFSPKGQTLAEFVADASNMDYYGGSNSQKRKKVKNEWILDALEVFEKDNAKNLKRFTAVSDAGAVEITKASGYTAYRNVDVEMTKAIAGNEDKLVLGYADDPSGIDAEASIKNGAVIIYQDTNNSTADFHERKQASIKE